MILDILFPPTCMICSKLGQYLCNNCRSCFPRSLPACFCCKKLNTGFRTHIKCRITLDVDFVFTQWLTNEHAYTVDNMILKNSNHLLLKELIALITERTIIEVFNSYRIESIKDKYKEANQYLTREIIKTYGSHKQSNNILLVGYKLDGLKDIQKQISSIRRHSPEMNIGIFLVFSTCQN